MAKTSHHSAPAGLLLGLALAIVLLVRVPAAEAQATSAPSPPPPQVQQLLQLMQDPAVRGWVDQQHQLAPTPATAEAAPPTFSTMMAARTASLREHLASLAAAAPRLPGEFRNAADRLLAELPGQRVLDVATGTGIAAEAALAIVGPVGSVLATDMSPEMVEKARQRLERWPNAAVAVEDGQALSMADESFDAVVCSLGLMFFPDPHLSQRPMADSVYKVIELVGTSTESWEKATSAAVERAAETLRDLRVPAVVEQDVNISDGKVESYRVKLKLPFKYEPGPGLPRLSRQGALFRHDNRDRRDLPPLRPGGGPGSLAAV